MKPRRPTPCSYLAAAGAAARRARRRGVPRRGTRCAVRGMLALAGSAALLGAGAGCAAPRPDETLARQTTVLDPYVIERMLRTDPIGAAEERHGALLLLSAEFSAHLLQLRGREARHLHRSHDLTFVLYRGQGDLVIEGQRRRMAPGHVYHVPRGVVHETVNTGDEPLVAIVIFTPPMEQEDVVPLGPEDQSYER